ncbi:MAG TPA: COX15/CtaA family protein [Gaiellaceae bacterium]|nr:COX15/CtaA family protein [Gaiellaceae bacterium]
MAVAVVSTRSVSARTFLWIALASCVALFLVITSGAFVRLTGSGLGCENWPSCGDKPYPEQGFHAWVEFGNRMVALVGIVLTVATWLTSRWATGLSRWGRWSALGAFLVAIAQIPMGGITIALDLHPLAVMTHFLLGLAAFGLALIAVLEGWSLRDGRAAAAGPTWLRQLVTFAGLPVCLTLVVTGAVVTASGPHPGSSEDVKRLGVQIVDTMYVHVRAAAVFGIGVLVVGWLLLRIRGGYPGLFRIWVGLLVVLVAQAILGEVQYRNALPWGLVLVHVVLAAAIWAFSLALAFTLWRPPRPLTRQ